MLAVLNHLPVPSLHVSCSPKRHLLFPGGSRVLHCWGSQGTWRVCMSFERNANSTVTHLIHSCVAFGAASLSVLLSHWTQELTERERVASLTPGTNLYLIFSCLIWAQKHVLPSGRGWKRAADVLQNYAPDVLLTDRNSSFTFKQTAWQPWFNNAINL